jgi:hypothetical protein
MEQAQRYPRPSVKQAQRYPRLFMNQAQRYPRLFMNQAQRYPWKPRSALPRGKLLRKETGCGNGFSTEFTEDIKEALAEDGAEDMIPSFQEGIGNMSLTKLGGFSWAMERRLLDHRY